MLSNSLGLIDRIVCFLSARIPLTYYGIINNELGKPPKSILDLGCGNGGFMNNFNSDKRYNLTGVDIFEPDLKEAEKLGIYGELITQDIQKVSFPEKSFDIVISNHLVEHFEKEAGFKFLEKIEKIAKEKVIIVTPYGFVEQHGHHDNDFQERLSGWYPEDFIARGYQVVGQGLGIFSRNKALAEFLTKIGPFRNIVFAIVILFQPLLAKNFKYTHQLICTKQISK